MRKFVYVVLSLFFLIPSVAKSGQLGDRVLVEIGSAFFSQHQLECYILIKAALSEKGWKAEIALPTAANWEKYLDMFVLDMAIQQESQRLGSFFPSDEAVNRAIEKIQKLEKVDLAFGTAVDNLRIEKRVLVRTIAMALQVSAYGAGKLGEVEAGGNSAKQKAWQEDLLNKFVIRILDGSKIYRQIHPPAAAKG